MSSNGLMTLSSFSTQQIVQPPGLIHMMHLSFIHSQPTSGGHGRPKKHSPFVSCFTYLGMTWDLDDKKLFFTQKTTDQYLGKIAHWEVGSPITRKEVESVMVPWTLLPDPCCCMYTLTIPILNSLTVSTVDLQIHSLPQGDPKGYCQHQMVVIATICWVLQYDAVTSTHSP